MDEENNISLAREDKDELEVLNVIKIAKAEKLRSDVVEQFLSVAAKFVKYPDGDFKKLLNDAADNLMLADERVRELVSRIGSAKPIVVNVNVNGKPELVEDTGDVKLQA